MESPEDKNQQHTISGEGLALSVYLHPACYSYAVTDLPNGSILDFEADIHTEVGDAINFKQLTDWIKLHHSLLNQPFETKRIAVTSASFQLLPNEDLAVEVPLLLMNKQDAGSVEVLTSRVSEDTIAQFGLDSRLYGLLTAHIDPADIVFGDLGFLRLLTGRSGDGVFCQVMDWDISVGVIREGRLQFFNKYRSKSPEDTLYYVLLAYQAHTMDPHTDRLYLCGLVEEDSALYELLFAYIKSIELITTDTFSFADGFPDGYQSQFHTNLFNLIV